MASGAQDVQAELQEYLNTKGINTLFIKIVEDLLLTKPDNPIKHVISFLHSNYPDEAGSAGGAMSGPFGGVAAQKSLEFEDEDTDEDESDEDDDVGDLAEIPKRRPVARGRRVSVSAESGGMNKLRMSWESQGKSQGIKKSEEEAATIRRILSKNMLFAFLDESQLEKLIFAMFPRNHVAGDTIIEQGTAGDNFYLVESGECEVFIKKSTDSAEEKVMTCTADEHNSFGELALMYNAPRAATVRAASNVKLWALGRLAFKVVLMETAMGRNDQRTAFLDNVKIMQTLNQLERRAVADALVPQRYNENDMIIRQGDPGTGFYIVKSGRVRCSRQASESSPPETLCELGVGEYFGEVSLLTNRPRQATVTAIEPSEVLCVSRKKFDRIMGPMRQLLQRNMTKYNEYMAGQVL